MSTKISALTAAGTIDAAADYLPIVTASLSTTQKINRNTLLGITGTPVGTSDSQALTNKTVGNTNTITTKDGSFTLQNTSDTTKQVVFALSGITGSTTRTLTVPDASLTLVGTATTQTLTNKTLTSPTITGGTYDNGTITVDAISGHTVATTVTVGNVQLANGIINTAGAVTATSIAAGGVQPQALVTGTGTGWSWQSYTPSWTTSGTAPSLGNGTLTGKYVQTGKTVHFRVTLVAGSTTTYGTGNYRFSFPVNSFTPAASDDLRPTGQFYATRQGTANLYGMIVMRNAINSYCELFYESTAGAATTAWSNITNSAPYTWANTDIISLQGTYEAV